MAGVLRRGEGGPKGLSNMRDGTEWVDRHTLSETVHRTPRRVPELKRGGSDAKGPGGTIRSNIRAFETGATKPQLWVLGKGGRKKGKQRGCIWAGRYEMERKKHGGAMRK